MKIQRPRGTQDLYGIKLRTLNQISEFIKNIFSLFGFSEIQTPVFEHISVFAENDSSELEVNKEFFHLNSKNNTDTYVLRPEYTSAVVRSAVENSLYNKQVTYPIRYFYCGPCFRYERPQFGRFRQFIQAGIETINSSSLEDDILNLQIMSYIFSNLNIPVQLELNYFGSKFSKSKWTNALKIYFSKYSEYLSSKSQQRIHTNPFRIFDDPEELKKDIVKNAPKIQAFLDSKELEEFSRIKTLLDKYNISYCWNNHLVRGIDYYTGLIYEWIWKEKDCCLTLAAGGRYDELFERFGITSVPSLGLAIGIERIYLALEKQNANIDNFFCVSFTYDYEYKQDMFDIFGILRKEIFNNWKDLKGITVITDLFSRDIEVHKKQVISKWGNNVLFCSIKREDTKEELMYKLDILKLNLKKKWYGF